MFPLELEPGKMFIIESDDSGDGYHIRIVRNSHILSELHLVPLNKFEPGDYYQKTFSSYPKKQGHGNLLIATLLQNWSSAIPLVNNIYSTSWVVGNNPDQSDFITQDAAMFWKKLIQKGVAEENSVMARFKILRSKY
jgi:hypothetical protein